MGWNDVDTNKNNVSTEVTYVKLPEGSTTLRIVDEEPYTRWTHWVPQANGGRGMSITCIGKGCPICNLIAEAKANKVKPKYNTRKVHSMNVINRTTNQLEVLEQGESIFKQLKAFHKEIGDIRDYDVKIIRSGKGLDTNYTCVPLQKKPLTEEEKKMFEQKVNFAEYYATPTKEQILALMDGANAKDIFEGSNDEEEVEVDFTKE